MQGGMCDVGKAMGLENVFATMISATSSATVTSASRTAFVKSREKNVAVRMMEG